MTTDGVASRHRWTRPPRVVVSGLLRDGLGLGEAARGYAAALDAAGCEVRQHFVRLPGRPFPLGDPGPGAVLDLAEAGPDFDADFSLWCLCPPEVEQLASSGDLPPRGRITAGLWIWDVDPVPPSWWGSARFFDEVWTPSPYVARVLSRGARLPLFTSPPAIRPLAPNGPSRLLDPGRPTVLALADTASSLPRKNPEGAIIAFRRAFRPGEGPRLVVKIWNGDEDPAGRARLEALANGRADIEVLDRWLSRRDFVSLLSACSCLLSLHRAEGFGLPIFEAVSLGVPVVSTAFSAPLDHLDDSSAYLVPARSARVPEGVPSYAAGSEWAEPDLDAAAAALRRLLSDPKGTREKAEQGRLVAGRLSPRAVGERLRAHIEARLTERMEAPTSTGAAGPACSAGEGPDRS